MKKEERELRIAELKREIASVKLDTNEDISTAGYYTDSGEPRYGNTTFTRDTLRSHPRVWINESTLPDVIANLELKENAPMYEKVRAMADLSYTGKLTVLGDGIGIEGNRNFAVTDSAKIEALAFMYLVTGDELYGYTAIAAAKNFLSTVKVRADKPSWDGNQIYDISNQCATAMGVMAEVYDWCYGILSSDDRSFIVKSVISKLAPTLEVANPPENTGCVTGHSTSTIVLRDWLTFAVAIADEYEFIYNHLLALIEYYYAPAPNWYYPSGANFQGSAYGINKTYLHMISELIMKVAGGKKLYAPDVSFEATIHTYIGYKRPDGESIRIGDDYNQYKTAYGNDIRMPVYGSFYCKNPMFKSWAMALTNDFNDIIFKGLLETTPIKVLLFNDPKLECDKNTRYNMPLVNYNGSPTGAITAREAWGDPDSWLTYVNIGEAYGANHNHKDAGTFQIYYKGILAPNTGSYQYYGTHSGLVNAQAYGSEYDFTYVKQTIATNGLLIFNPAHKNHIMEPDRYDFIYDGKTKAWLNPRGDYYYNSEKQRWVFNKANTASVGSIWYYSGGQDTTTPGVNSENATLDQWLAKKTSHQAKELAHAYEFDKDGKLSYAYISGDITEAYASDTAELVMRSAISLATADEKHPLLFIVYDRITAKDPSFKKTFLLHTTNEPEFAEGAEVIKPTVPDNSDVGESKKPIAYDAYTHVEGSNVFSYTNKNGAAGAVGFKAADKYNGRLTVTALLPESPDISYIGGDGHRFWVNGTNVGYEGDPTEMPFSEIGWGRVEISPKEQNKTDSFLNVMYVSDAEDTEHIAAKLIKCETHEGAISFGKCVMFSKSRNPVKDTVSFNSTADGTLEYFVSGLASGKWQIKLNGKEQNQISVSEEAGIARFAANGGNIDLIFIG